MAGIGFPDFQEVSGARLLVALSGGADSVALLHMLNSARHRLNLTLTAAHVEHGIRGAQSREDAEFCRRLCATLRIPFHMTSVDVPHQARPGEGLETAARRLRYEALHEIRRSIDADYIALAHHLNDQAETVLMHLLRGCGPDGVGAMERRCGFLYRPLLDIPKSRLIRYLESRKLVWREDDTNRIVDTPRNALRLNVLPLLEKSYPRSAEALARYAEAARCENRLLEKMTDEFLAGHLEPLPFGQRIRDPLSTDEAILRRALRRVIGSSLNAESLRTLVGLCGQLRGSMTLPGGIQAERTPGWLYILLKAIPSPAPVPVRIPGITSFSLAGILSAEPGPAVPLRDDPLRQALRRDALEGAVLRTRRDGDRFRPMGCGDKLLSDVLIDRKVDRPLRDHLPLLARGNRILWAVGLGISEEVKLRDDDDEALILRWIPETFAENKPTE
ncbi:MAG: tRNA lysidine(34) synthetase TilS [Christensenellales bacterium]|nr:tRNA lysidine(34) synthetase TilS [Christensenellales bacterium]